MRSLTFEWDSESVAQVRRKLGKYQSEAPKVLRNAANKTAVSARARLRQEAQARYTVKTGGFNSRANITRATLANPTAIITFRGRPLTSKRFHYTAPATGAKLEVLKGEGLKPLVISDGVRTARAFTGGVVSGDHVTGQILQRKADPKTGKIAGRYPLKVMRSVGIAKMIETVYDGRGLKKTPLKDEIDKLYKHYTDQEIQRVING